MSDVTLTDAELAAWEEVSTEGVHPDELAVVERIVAARVAQARADAWDKACDFHHSEGPGCSVFDTECPNNPYREAATEPES